MKKCLNIYIKHEDFYELQITRMSGEKIICYFDIGDYDLIKKYQWHAIKQKNKFYLATSVKGKDKYLHKILMNEKNKIVDHIDGNSLNNRRTNLRYCSSQENGRNLKQGKSKTGIIGVRKDLRCKNSYRAQIYFSKTEHIEKTYKDFELAVIQRLCWELMYFNEFAPQIELIKEKYPFLLGYNKVKGKMVFSTDIENIRDIGNCLKNDPHCPCMLVKNENTICPCLPCRAKGKCCCEMFAPIEEDKNKFKEKYPKKYEIWIANFKEEKD